jgi:serine/threonine protein kinase
MMKQGPLSSQTLGGKYLLGELLGQGGFGAVYKAENQMLHRSQAIKVLLEERFSDEKFRDRFLREARTLGTLDHANIVHVDDIGIEGNLIYLVMPYISGGTLQDVLRARSGPLGLDEILRYLEQICSALGYAHAQGVVHLDLKPLNLLAHQDGRLLLSDFGLAHLMEQGAVEGGTSLQFGSPLYMAPEHFDGKPGQHSDMYALGVILYQMLAGRHPFEASTPAAIMRKHLTEPPPPLQAVRPDLPPALDAVLAKVLAKQPEQRYGRAGELLFDFRAALGGQALQFASSAEPTRISQAYLDPTQRVSNPPVAPAERTAQASGPFMPPAQPLPVPPPQGMPMPAPGQPFIYQASPPGFYSPDAPRPVSVPVATSTRPGKREIWTPGFTRLFVLTAIAGGAAMLVVIPLIRANNLYSLVAAQQIILFVLGAVALICLVGLVFTHSKLLRVGLLLQAGSLASNFIRFVMMIQIIQSEEINFDPSIIRWAYVYLPLILTVLNAASLTVICYELARWQGVRDIRWIVLQVIVSVLGSYLLLNDALVQGFDFGLSVDVIKEGSPFIMVAVALFAASVFILRPACWKQQPAVTLLLALGALLCVIQAPGGFNILNRPSDLVASDSVLSGGFLLAWLLLLLGILLLIQTERARRRVQQLAVPALAGQQP